MRYVKTFFVNFPKIWLAGLLWLVASIPVVTIGASTTALIYVEMQIIRGTLDGPVAHNFFKSFKINFKHCTILFLIYAGLYAVLFLLNRYFGIDTDANGADKISTVGFICYAVMAVMAFSLTYIFAVPARFTNPVRGTVIYAFVISIRHLFSTLVIIASWFGISFLAELSNITLIVLAAGGLSVLFYLYSIVYSLSFIPYIPKDMRTPEEQSYADKKHLDPAAKEENTDPDDQANAENQASAENQANAEALETSKEEEAAADAEKNEEFITGGADLTDKANVEVSTETGNRASAGNGKFPKLQEKGGYAEERPDLRKMPTGTYPRGRKHSMADIIAATSNEAEEDED